MTSNGTRANLYDQIIIDPAPTQEWTGQAGVVEDVGLDLRQFRAKVSDHLPVWATFGTEGPDDD